MPAAPGKIAGSCDHGRIVCTKNQRRTGHFDTCQGGSFRQATAQAAVGGNTAGDDQSFDLIAFHGGQGMVDQNIDDCLLEAGSKVCQRYQVLPGLILARGDRLQAVQLIERCRFQTAEGKVQTVREICLWQLNGIRSTALRSTIEQRSPRIAQPHGPGNLVKCFAGGIITRPCQNPILSIVLDQDNMAVSARHHQANERRFQVRISQIVSRYMTANMVHADQRFTGNQRESLGGCQPDQQCADKPRPLSRGQHINLLERHASLDQRLVNHRQNRLKMHARSDLRNDAAELAVKIRLRRDDVGQDDAAIGHNCCRCFITG